MQSAAEKAWSAAVAAGTAVAAYAEYTAWPDTAPMGSGSDDYAHALSALCKVESGEVVADLEHIASRAKGPAAKAWRDRLDGARQHRAALLSACRIAPQMEEAA